MAETETPEEIEAPTKGGLGALILALVVTTAIGVGGGVFLGTTQVDNIVAIATKRANEAPKADERALAWDKSTTVARLDPIITNLASPPGARIRLETAMVFSVESVGDVEHMKAMLAEDILAFVRTVSLAELNGASSFNYLRDDLNERVRTTSAGMVRELLIEGMVLQ